MTIFLGAMDGGMGKTWEKPSFSPVNGVVDVRVTTTAS